MLSTVALQGGAGAALLVWLLFLVVHLGLIVWTYSDAEQYSDHPAFLWAIVVFFAPILGILLYLILGRTKR